MTVSSTSSRVVYAGNGSTTVFPFAFKVAQASELAVVFTDASGVDLELSPSQYGATGFGQDAGGSVTYPLSGDPIANGTRLTIYRDVPLTQPTQISNQGAMWPQVIEAALDRLTMMVQSFIDGMNRSIRVSRTDDHVVDDLPPPAQRASRFLAFDNDGNVQLVEPSIDGGIGVVIEGSGARINVRNNDPIGYWTPLYVVASNNEDNVVTLRSQTSNINGHTAIRLQDHAGAERAAFGLGGSFSGTPFRYTAFMEGGNIASNYGSMDTSIMLGVTHRGDPNISDGFVPRVLVVPSAYNGSADSGGWTRIGAENRGAAVNAIVIDRQGRVGIGTSITQSAYPNNNTGSDPSVVATLQVNGSAYFDQDNLALSSGAMANSTDLVVVRSQSTGKASVRIGVANTGSIDIGVASGNGAVGVDGSLKMLFKTGITGGNLATGTEGMRLDSGILLVGTTVNTNAGTGDARLNGALWIRDGMAAPTNAAGFAAIYVDGADGNLKVKFDDGTIKTLATGS